MAGPLVILIGGNDFSVAISNVTRMSISTVLFLVQLDPEMFLTVQCFPLIFDLNLLKPRVKRHLF